MERTGGWAAEARAKAVLTRLGLTDYEAHVDTLSGGQRKRVALAQTLLTPTDLLILDEPTNHIDADTVDWLEEYLLAVPNALLLVTHDRYFLDRVANRIIELDRRKLISYTGNYSRYLEQRAERHQKLAAAEEKQRKLIQRELAWVHRSPMARGTKQKARKQRLEELQKIEYDKGDQRVVMTLAGRRLGKRVLEAKGLSKAYGDLQLFNNIDFELGPGDRIGIIGPNGAGKSTLLDILAGVTKADRGQPQWGETVHLGYYDQQSRGLIAGIEADMTVLEFVNKEAPLIRTQDGHRLEAAQILEWFLFTRPQQQAKLVSLSGGERRRLYLLTILIHRPNVLFLDEPTNDLDLQTLNVVEEFMDHFQGTLVVVSHDRYFLDRTVDFLASFENGRFSPRYPAPYSSYQRLRQEAETAVATSTKPVIKTAPKRTNNRPRKLTWKEARELEALDNQIEALETEKETVKTAVNEAGSDYQELNRLAQRLEAIEAELETILERWLELSEIAENS